MKTIKNNLDKPLSISLTNQKKNNMIVSGNIPYYPYKEHQLKCQDKPIAFPKQHQKNHPGFEYLMNPLPIFDNPRYVGSGKLKGQVALITGGDSGIGRAVSIGFAKEGADIAIGYLYEHEDANITKQLVEKYGVKCLLIPLDLSIKTNCTEIIKQVIQYYKRLDILVLNHGVQYPQKDISHISPEQIEKTFTTNILSYILIAREAVPYLIGKGKIIMTTSVTAYKGLSNLVDYSSTKGAVVSFVRSLSLQLIEKGIRVNGVAPGPIWTPLIVSSFSAEYVETFGTDTPMKRAGQPFELAPTYIYLASDDSSYVSGQILHVNGGTITES